MVTLGQKSKMPKTCRKHCTRKLKLFYAKRPVKKNTKYLRNETILKICHLAKTIAFAKSSVLVKKYKWRKHSKNYSTRTLKLFCAKKRSKTHQIFEKWDNFENRPSCKGYSLCKMVSLEQNLKMLKTCQRPFYTNMRVVFFKNRSKKAPNIREMR